MEQRLSVVTLGVENLERSRSFYEDLGWAMSPASQESIIFFQLGGMILALYERQALAEDACVPNTPTGFSGLTLAYCARTQAEVDVLLAKAVQAGARLLKPAQEVFWGGYSGYFADPDAHIWEVAFNPFWTLAEDGAVVLPT